MVEYNRKQVWLPIVECGAERRARRVLCGLDCVMIPCGIRKRYWQF